MATSNSGDPRITAALALLAARRQASNLDDDTLDLFSADLTHPARDGDRFGVDVIVDACERIGRTERAEGETAFPSLGTLLRVCREVVKDRYWQGVEALAAQAPDAPMLPEPTRDEAKRVVERFHETVKRMIREKRA